MVLMSRSGCTSVRTSETLGSAAIRAFTFDHHQQPAPSKGPRTELYVKGVRCRVPFAVAAAEISLSKIIGSARRVVAPSAALQINAESPTARTCFPAVRCTRPWENFLGKVGAHAETQKSKVRAGRIVTAERAES